MKGCNQIVMRRVTWLALVVTAVACGGGFKPDAYPTPVALFEAAKAEYQKGNCGGATRGFSRVVFELPPRDPRIAEARYLLGECRIDSKEYLEASRDLRRAADDFPTHEVAPMALMRSGDALGKLWKRAELDPTYGEQALSVYSEVLQRYPNSSAAALTRERVGELGDRFAIKDLKTGDFYFRIKAFDSAIIYYRAVITSWPQSQHAPLALMKLVETYQRIGYEEEVIETCAHLRRFYAEAEGLSDVCPDSVTTS
ncbi:MAG: outer membrane protein assembly factor BamD [Gemmatimonadota bacterium]|nr:outer membrane protein assembly factor BamD [Gemmatimonadota bacterium]